MVTLQAFVNIEARAKQERREQLQTDKDAQKIDYQMSETNHGQAFIMEKTTRVLKREEKEARESQSKFNVADIAKKAVDNCELIDV